MASINVTDPAALSVAAGPIEPPLLDVTIGQQLATTVAEFPERDALVEAFSGRRWTWLELGADVNAVARGLLALGLQPGDRLALWSPDRAEWILTQFAAAKLGVILVGLDPALQADDLRDALEQSGATAIIASDAQSERDYPAMVDQIRSNTNTVRHVVTMDNPSWSAFLEAGERIDPDEPLAVAASLRPDEPITLRYTAEDTGELRGVALSHLTIVNSGYLTAELIQLDEHDKVVIAPSLHHGLGMVAVSYGVLTHGSTMVIAAPRFDAADALAAIQTQQATALYGLPSTYAALVKVDDLADYDLSSLRTGLMAGPGSSDLVAQAISGLQLATLSTAYATPETSIIAQGSTPDRGDGPTATVGQAHPHLEIKVVDSTSGSPVPRGQTGELRARGYSIMLGYWQQPDRTAAVIDTDGWVHLRARAVMSVDGYLTVEGAHAQ